MLVKRLQIGIFLTCILNAFVLQGLLHAQGREVQKPKESYPVSEWRFSYGREHPALPSLDPLKEMSFELGVKDGVYVSANESDTTVTVRLGDKVEEVKQFSDTALRQILADVVDYFNQQDYYGVFAMVDRAYIDPRTGRDKRKKENTELGIVVWFSTIDQIRTVGRGRRLSPEETVDNDRHSLILKGSPISFGSDEEKGDILTKSLLENYLRRLSRHPGRQVDVAISSAGELGEVVLDFLVNENKPYVVYGQVSNTGTKSTGDWRERVGFVHHQLTNRDDVLSVDFITAELNKSNAWLASYQIPILYPNYLKLRVYGAWSEYDGDEIGVADIAFSGGTTSFGAELSSNPFIIGRYNIDFVGGVRSADIEVERTGQIEGQTTTWIPYISAAVIRRSQLFSTNASLTFEKNVNNVPESQKSGGLGRSELDANWEMLKGTFRLNFFLEPLLWGDDWKDRSTWLSSTLAHEIDFRFRMQHTLSNRRVVPQEQFIIGGFSSVRGYRESVASGDSGYVMNLEYRYHLPRSLKPYMMFEDFKGKAAPPKKFLEKYNLRPPSVYGRPDWDLIFRGFFDYGHTNVNDKQTIDNDLTLMSVGAGIELQLLSNLNIHVDWGYILNTLVRNSTKLEEADSGDTRVHFITTLSW